MSAPKELAATATALAGGAVIVGVERPRTVRRDGGTD